MVILETNEGKPCDEGMAPLGDDFRTLLVSRHIAETRALPQHSTYSPHHVALR